MVILDLMKEDWNILRPWLYETRLRNFCRVLGVNDLKAL